MFGCLGQAQSAHRASSSRLASTSSSPSCQGRRLLSLDLWSILLHWCLVTKQSSHVKSCQVMSNQVKSCQVSQVSQVICCLIWCLSRVSFDTCCILVQLVQLVQLYSLMYSLCCQLYCVTICHNMSQCFPCCFSCWLAPRPSGPPQRITADSVIWTDVRAWRPGQSDNFTTKITMFASCSFNLHIYIY